MSAATWLLLDTDSPSCSVTLPAPLLEARAMAPKVDAATCTWGRQSCTPHRAMLATPCQLAWLRSERGRKKVFFPEQQVPLTSTSTKTCGPAAVLSHKYRLLEGKRSALVLEVVLWLMLPGAVGRDGLPVCVVAARLLLPEARPGGSSLACCCSASTGVGKNADRMGCPS